MNRLIASLAAWLDSATVGLPPSAAGKFRAEIADHFAESRSTHLAAGMSLEEAEQAALIDLGDAEAVGRTLRDGHFSRDRYAQGMLAAAALLLVSLPGAVAAVLSDSVNEAHLPNPYSQWTWVINFVLALIGAPLLILAGRALLTLLREHYEVSVPRWAGRLLAGCALATMPAGLLIPAIVWAYYSPPAWNLRYSTLSNDAFLILPAAQALHQIGTIAAGGLLIALSVRLLRNPQPGLSLLAIPAGLSGLVLVAAGGVQSVAIFLPQPYPQNVPLILFVNSLSTALSLLVIAPEVILLALFAAMRRPGAILAG